MGAVALNRGWAIVGYRSKGDRGSKVVPALYTVWVNFRRRCRTDSQIYYRWYKAKGIRVCDEWQDYEKFRAWALSSGYRKGLWIDRINGNGNYEPRNCQWVRREDQIHNMSHIIHLTFNGVTKPMPVWAREYGHTPQFVGDRLRKGWTTEQALTILRGQGRPGVRRGRKAHSYS